MRSIGVRPRIRHARLAPRPAWDPIQAAEISALGVLGCQRRRKDLLRRAPRALAARGTRCLGREHRARLQALSTAGPPAIVAFLLERHAQQTEIKTFGSAAFWTTTQLLTVSSQIKNPISVGGRILDVFMEIYAITVIATLAGAIGTFLQKRGEETKDKR